MFAATPVRRSHDFLGLILRWDAAVVPASGTAAGASDAGALVDPRSEESVARCYGPDHAVLEGGFATQALGHHNFGVGRR